MQASDKIAIAAAIIAACAFFATVWQAHLAHTHNRLSVRPLLVWARERTVNDTGTEVIFMLRNCGVGPAIITERVFLVDEKPFLPPTDTKDEVEAFVRSVLGSKCAWHLRAQGLPGLGSAFPAGDSQVIARIFFPNHSLQMVDDLLAQISTAEFRVRYESLYKERFVLLAT
ncbi:hypothetical protein DW355_08055 [Hylemonella gracilis]|uniref:Uncharacterized protein n=1 Tax=Hylemonella gracilis TaxID=80880 RepID=A0A4P6UMH2_9BURK|nr:hypothetical protein [Hylemonella gracilis]QBK04731.1 hypothetical protein DW355_08055 [Hylemonella gracilis]